MRCALLTTAACILAVAAAPRTRADEPEKAAAPEKTNAVKITVATADEIARLVSALDSDEYKERDQATRALLKIGTSALESLQSVIDGSVSLEHRTRAQYIIDRIGPGIVNGLRIVVTANRKEVRPGENVTFTTRLINTTDTPLNVYMGYSYGSFNPMSRVNFMVTGKPVAVGKTTTISVAGRRMVRRCGTGRIPAFLLLKPYDSVAYRSEAQLVAAADAKSADNYRFQSRRLAAPAGDEHRFSVTFSAAKSTSVTKSTGFAGSIDKNANYWTGTVTSPTVALKVLPAKQEDAWVDDSDHLRLRP